MNVFENRAMLRKVVWSKKGEVKWECTRLPKEDLLYAACLANNY
jgi:hypothetical protein